MKEQKREGLMERLGRLRRKLCSKIPRLSRPWRIVRNLVCIVFGVYLIWVLMGGYPLTKAWAFRRAERRDMVGPSEMILEQWDENEVTLVGRTEQGYFLGTFSREINPLRGWYTQGTLYVERQEDVTFTVAKTDRYGGIIDEHCVELLLLCDDPAVTRGTAEVTFTGDGSIDGRRFEVDETYTVEFLPEREGVLAGRLQPKTDSGAGWEGQVERFVLSWIYSTEIPVTIRLYDGGGALLLERSMEYVHPIR